MGSNLPAIPYCGVPPLPDALWSRWNLDPVLLIALLACAAFYEMGARAGGTGERASRQPGRLFFLAGWLIGSVALISPLCALSVSLFAARVGQHMLLVLVSAPLIAAGRPVETIAAAFGPATAPPASAPPRTRRGAGRSGLLAAAAFAALLWIWHSPRPYAATFASPVVYWAMHASLFGAAMWLWSCLIGGARAGRLSTAAAALISSVQMGLLGALLTLAPHPLFAPHLATTAAWGLTPLQDQQLGGAIMWVPGCVVFLAVSMLGLWQALSRHESAHSLEVAVR